MTTPCGVPGPLFDLRRSAAPSGPTKSPQAPDATTSSSTEKPKKLARTHSSRDIAASVRTSATGNKPSTPSKPGTTARMPSLTRSLVTGVHKDLSESDQQEVHYSDGIILSFLQSELSEEEDGISRRYSVSSESDHSQNSLMSSQSSSSSTPLASAGLTSSSPPRATRRTSGSRKRSTSSLAKEEQERTDLSGKSAKVHDHCPACGYCTMYSAY